MMGFLIDTVIMALIIGGAIGSIAAAQYNHAKKVPVKVERNRSAHQRRIH